MSYKNDIFLLCRHLKKYLIDNIIIKYIYRKQVFDILFDYFLSRYIHKNTKINIRIIDELAKRVLLCITNFD